MEVASVNIQNHSFHVKIEHVPMPEKSNVQWVTQGRMLWNYLSLGHWQAGMLSPTFHLDTTPMISNSSTQPDLRTSPSKSDIGFKTKVARLVKLRVMGCSTPVGLQPAKVACILIPSFGHCLATRHYQTVLLTRRHWWHCCHIFVSRLFNPWLLFLVHSLVVDGWFPSGILPSSSCWSNQHSCCRNPPTVAFC